MRHVAALAGVGTKTVSRVVNGEPNVSEATIERVRHAIERLHYQPNLDAANLKRANGRTLTLGFLVGNLADPFSAAVLRAIEEKAWERKTAVISASHDYNPERELQIIKNFVGRRVDGIILRPANGRHSFRALEAAQGIPVVFLGALPSGAPADAVTTDNAAGAAQAADHLLRLGHRRTAYCGAVAASAGDVAAEERYLGFMEKLGQAGIAARDIPVLQNLQDAETARNEIAQLIQSGPRPTAIFTAGSAGTAGAIKALRENGANNSIALVGFDDFPLADLVDPGITVIAQDVEGIGRIAAETLFARVDGFSGEPATHLIPATLKERGSGEIRSRSASRRPYVSAGIS
ncbi:LacI family DNA-binding transcriptional regulator [Arthrobacter globiformis]|uniref:LacI family DNA-binding transcriptional regulator n=1 Tax=Arthrobacter globiformis TaxID=1665 RepID=UPI00278558B4|nr:LacI family DNA-binding transcriptional regulator [Arthrobacter globiformis]MDQ0862745.1 DNA-binding LacI/PurR family transcriptional regulator [Arthrobacter globiformis]